MPPVRSIKNQYLGINAHLHSFWQAKGGWHNFHNRHIGDLAGLLRQQLLPMGYTAVMEESLQVRRVGDETRKPRADILIGDLNPARSSHPFTPAASTLTVAEMIEAEQDLEKPYRALGVYEHDDQLGEPVAWLELLSPTNKGSDQDALTYLAKRRLLLEQRITFVEIDYLHETPPTFTPLKDYTHKIYQSQGAHPYRIVVLDPHPDMRKGPAQPSEFDVDQPIPTIHIPLSAGESMDFDFGVGYRKTFEEMFYGLEIVDYSHLPLNFERYSVADQMRIAQRMLAVLEATHAGINLENAPFEVKEIPLETALAQIKTLAKN